MWLSCFRGLPRSAEAQVIWGGIVKRLLIAYFIGNISAEKYQNPFMCDKVIASQRLDIFWDTVYCRADSTFWKWLMLSIQSFYELRRYCDASDSCCWLLNLTVSCIEACVGLILDEYTAERNTPQNSWSFVAMESCICRVIFRAVFTSAHSVWPNWAIRDLGSHISTVFHTRHTEEHC